MDEAQYRPRAPERIELGDDAFLRQLVPEDADVVYATVDRDRARLRPWLPWVDASHSPADTRRFIEETIATEGREYAYGIWAADGFAGTIGLHTDPENRSAMIGYWIDAAHEGKGMITRAARAITDVALRDLRMHRVWLNAAKDNRRSWAVADRLGFRREGVRRESTLVDGRFQDTVLYAVLEHEWPPARD